MQTKKGTGTPKNNGRKSGKVVLLSSWKDKKKELTNEKQYKNYLNVLGLNELIEESSDLIKELKHRPLNAELSGRSKLVLQQFNHRLAPSGTNQSATLRALCKKIEQKIKKGMGLEN